MRILVADDSVTFLNMITDSLQRLGHEVVQASSGEGAIELFREATPDLVILDVVMDGMSGFDAAREIRKISTEDWIPIIFLSSTINDKSIAKGIEAGGDDYLTKPYSEVTIEAKIKAMSRIAEMRQKLLVKRDELQLISTTDILTGLNNRFQFGRLLKAQIGAANRHHHSVALLFIDLDHFKTINDKYGHGIGDLLLREVAQRIETCTRVDDFVARIGGDEFVMILSHVENNADVGVVAQKIIDIIAKEFTINDLKIKITASVGVTLYPDEAKDEAILIQNADIAMYSAKESGRNNFQFFTEQLNERYRHHLGLEHELKYAVDRKELSVVYQPIFDVLKKRVVGVEALLRWEHPDFGSIPPDVFVPIAEETGLINEIGYWVLNVVCGHAKKWVEKYSNDFVFSINVSIHQINSDSFVKRLSETISQEMIHPSNMEIELTESTMITYTKPLKDTMRHLSSMGIGISIDDFGTRYSTLTSLRHLPITTLKIDRDFVKNVDRDKKNSVIVKSLIALGENLDLKVIAEGIQSEEQLQFLMINGCRYCQGDYLMKPLSCDELNTYLKIEA